VLLKPKKTLISIFFDKKEDGTIALPRKLGFGMMRLSVIGDDPTNFNYDQIYQMVDTFLNNGFTYFDISHVYQFQNQLPKISYTLKPY